VTLDAQALAAMAVAAGGLLSPGSLLVTLLLLSLPNGVRKAAGLLAGYVVGYTALCGVVLVVGQHVPRSPGAGDGGATSTFSIAAGVLLLLLGLRSLRRPTSSSTSSWSAKLQTWPTWRVVAMGVAIPVLNVKNLAMFLSACGIVVAAHHAWSTSTTLAVCGAIVACFCLSVAAPLVVTVVGGNAVQSRLAVARQWLERRASYLGGGVALVLGILLLLRGVWG